MTAGSSLLVIPAQAGISGVSYARFSPETPASAGVTDLVQGYRHA